jgi:hypothetical protein
MNFSRFLKRKNLVTENAVYHDANVEVMFAEEKLL